jgi:hypothetical protein
LVHDSAVRALLPIVVNVGELVFTLWSQGAREARLPTTSSQSAGLDVARQHQFSRTSVLGLFHESSSSRLCSGVPGKMRQRAVNGDGGALSSIVIVPLYVRGSTGPVLLSNSHTWTK